MLRYSHLTIDSLQILNANLGIIDPACENLEIGRVSLMPCGTSRFEDRVEHLSDGDTEYLPRICRTGLQRRARCAERRYMRQDCGRCRD